MAQTIFLVWYQVFVSDSTFLFSVISHGINAGDVKKLQDAGIYTCNGLMMQTKKVTLFILFSFFFFLSLI